MFVFLSKFLPLFVYPLGLACVLLILALIRSSTRVKSFLISGALILLWLGGNRWVAYSLARSLEWRYLPPKDIPQAEAIVVLGGGTEAPSYPRLFVEVNGAGDRVLFAARFINKEKHPISCSAAAISPGLASAVVHRQKRWPTHGTHGHPLRGHMATATFSEHP